MGVTALGATPQNQLDALPILTVDQVASPGELSVIGGTVSRYFSAAVLGMSELQRVGIPAVGQTIVGPSAYIDVTGCNHFMFLVRRNALDAIADDNDQPQLRVQKQIMGANMNDPTSLSLGLQPVVGVFGGFVALGGPYPQFAYAIGGWSNGQYGAAAGAGTAQIVGPRVRFYLQFSDGPVNPANQLWSLEIYAQT